MTGNRPVSDKTIGRLSLYRRLLNELPEQAVQHIFSYDLAQMAGVTPAQVRRDLMNIATQGSAARGYDIAKLREAIGRFLDSSAVTRAVLVGVGNIGRAILAYLPGRSPGLEITASFDSDPLKYNRVIAGIRCYALSELTDFVREQHILVGIIAVPAAAAQEVTDQLVRGGVTGLLNFAPVPLKTPITVYNERLDITTCLEKVAYFARLRNTQRSGYHVNL